MQLLMGNSTPRLLNGSTDQLLAEWKGFTALGGKLLGAVKQLLTHNGQGYT